MSAAGMKVGTSVAVYIFVKGVMGAGIFSMGTAFQMSGLALGIPLTILLGLLNLHCEHMLVQCSVFVKEDMEISNFDKSHVKLANLSSVVTLNSAEESVDLAHSNFGFIAQYMFSKCNSKFINRLQNFIRKFVNVCICLQYFGICCVYLCFMSKTFKAHLDKKHLDIKYQVIILILTLPIWAFSMITHLNLLAPFIIFAGSVIVGGVIIFLGYMLPGLEKREDVELIGKIENFPIFMTVTLFSYENTGMVLPLRSEMKRPHKMDSYFGVLNLSFFICATCTTITGALAFSRYGNTLKDSVTMNLPHTPIVNTVSLLITLQILISYPIQLYVPVSIIWPAIDNWKGPFKHPYFAMRVVRTFLVFCTVLVAVSLPFIDLIVSMVGSVCSPAITVFMPAVLDVLKNYLCRYTAKRRRLIICKDAMIILLGVIVFVGGTLRTTHEIIRNYRHSERYNNSRYDEQYFSF